MSWSDTILDIHIRGQEDREPIYSCTLGEVSPEIAAAAMLRLRDDAVTSSELDVDQIAEAFGQTPEAVRLALGVLVKPPQPEADPAPKPDPNVRTPTPDPPIGDCWNCGLPSSSKYCGACAPMFTEAQRSVFSR